ncbi:other/FunK1 protein kinase [Coprinopsis cinerea okayama7|uniref:Other/FunK1 protein kinase n=1 Tax=Coprinopsis cinerea (strain Okayama-7 / 130 / ATCC MYA-4618 / FGSC 9003) TaxID=240176 RepID=A8NAC0_COPC7|nr:other/FunK1 protein kinase [Coprinopsis cinerea okayama7\|eukprot:XP_001831772.2 other/FunK1 protein kinase [Coprinopsis cinerea okayama7\
MQASPLSLRSHGLAEYEDVVGLVEYLFPDAALPLAASTLVNSFTHNDEIYSPSSQAWKGYPVSFDRGQHAAELCVFLNMIGRRLRDICAESRMPVDERIWTLQKIDYSNNNWTPELELVPIDGPSKPTLAGARLFLRSYRSAFNGAARVFKAQEDRQFYLCAQFDGPQVRLLYYDHQRFASSELFNAHQDTLRFIRMLAGLTLGSYRMLGQSPFIVYEDDHRVLKGWNPALECRVVKTLHPLSDTKNSSVAGANEERERDIPGVPQVQAIEVLTSSKDSIFLLLSKKPTPARKPQPLMLRRITMVPCADALLSYRDNLELLSVFMDTIQAHLYLLEGCNILHRNISVWSIMMFDSSRYLDLVSLQHCVLKPLTKRLLRAGLLTSFGHAIQLQDDVHSASDPNCLHGDYTSVAVELLVQGPKCPHHVRHDLESFFWTFCVVGTPSTDAILRILGQGEHINKANGAARQVGIRKWGMVCNESAFRATLLAHFLPRFAPLRPLACKLRELLFGDGIATSSTGLGQDVTHDDMIDAFKSVVQVLLREVEEEERVTGRDALTTDPDA